MRFNVALLSAIARRSHIEYIALVLLVVYTTWLSKLLIIYEGELILLSVTLKWRVDSEEKLFHLEKSEKTEDKSSKDDWS